MIPNTGDWGWRWALLIGALPLLYAIVTRVHIPESVRGRRASSLVYMGTCTGEDGGGSSVENMFHNGILSVG